MPLVSAATLREYLPEIGDNTSADTELNSLIARVEAAVARYLGFPPPASSSSFTTLDQSTYTLYLDGPTYLDRNVLQLPIKPVVSITSIFSDLIVVIVLSRSHLLLVMQQVHHLLIWFTQSVFCARNCTEQSKHKERKTSAFRERLSSYLKERSQMKFKKS